MNGVEHWRARYGYGKVYDAAVSANGAGDSGEGKGLRKLLRRTDDGADDPAATGDEESSPESKKGAPPS